MCVHDVGMISACMCLTYLSHDVVIHVDIDRHEAGNPHAVIGHEQGRHKQVEVLDHLSEEADCRASQDEGDHLPDVRPVLTIAPCSPGMCAQVGVPARRR